MVEKSSHLQVILQQSALKHSRFAIKDMQAKTRGVILLYNTGIDSSTRNNFAKVSFPAQPIIPWRQRLRYFGNGGGNF